MASWFKVTRAAAQFGRRYFTDVEWGGVGCDTDRETDRDPSRDQHADVRSHGTQNRSHGKKACRAKDRALTSTQVSDFSAQSSATNGPCRAALTRSSSVNGVSPNSPLIKRIAPEITPGIEAEQQSGQCRGRCR